MGRAVGELAALPDQLRSFGEGEMTAVELGAGESLGVEQGDLSAVLPHHAWGLQAPLRYGLGQRALDKQTWL